MQLSQLFSKKTNLEFSTQKKQLGNLPGTALALTIASLAQQRATPLLVLCVDPAMVVSLKQDLFYLCPKIPIYDFPDWETLPYDQLSPHQDIISARLKLLSTVTYLKQGIILTSTNAIMPRLCPIDYIRAQSFILKKGDQRDIETLSAELVRHGYLKVNQVLEHGEFALRGSLLDLFPMGSDEPYRIDFLDDEVDSISTFEVETQRSLKQLDKIELLPAHEYPLDENSISIFRSNYRDAFPGVNLREHVIYQAISRGAIPAGIEYYLPLFFAGQNSFLDFLPPSTALITVEDVEQAAQNFDLEAHKRFNANEGLADHPPLEVYRVFLSPQELHKKLGSFETIGLRQAPFSAEELQRRGINNADFQPVPEMAFIPQDKSTAAGLISFVTDFIQNQGRILLTAISEGRRQTLREILPQALTDSFGITSASSTEDFLERKEPLQLSIASYDRGFIAPSAKLALLTENDLFGYKAVKQRQRSHKSALSQEAMIKNLSQLTEGQVVVHIDHGIGRYRGLRTMVIGGVKGEFLAIEYQNGDMLNIPITSLNKVARYSGSENPPLSRLGTDTWGKKKQKAAEKVRDVAAELLDLYARREAGQGMAFPVDFKALDEFASGFSYEETPDQLTAINATLNDLSQHKPMDRLICGDVGFGKTEVALRAAFVVANAGYQVAVLVPTTILAEQHYENFKERFAGTPIVVEGLSRFKTVREQNETIERLKQGSIDIVIGTHKLLNKSVQFKHLGLVIVDEEHRFGVKQKEKLKELRASVDLLTLTATPIPRTLNMAMEGMRELSIIATPPEHRLAVKTFVMQQSNQICREAILRELRRGGQVYYLHNDVSTIYQKQRQLEELVPEAKIGIGHGQMPERELQRVMRDFYQQRFNLLLCSTIIENGLDVATANTIIIDRADLLGLAQLHQIRGRVGRSHHQAYAYLFTPPEKLLSKDAKLRLDAIASLEELGAGFVLATHDLEIRGAGDLLGVEQSGQIESVGFSLYVEMLAHAVKALKEGREPSLQELTLNECDVDLHLPCLLPDTYIGDINTRLSLYKRLSSCESPEQYEDLKVELIDRFGLLPDAALNLFAISRLKKQAGALGIVRISGDGEGGTIELRAQHKIDPNYLILLVTSCKHNEYRISGQNNLRYNLPESPTRSRLELLRQLLLALQAHSTLANKESL
ncbi:MAG: transcription-repair coupling factor [Succinivibrio sp.]|nr:transcription-repair coupling factor [Succinivibrio sp.]